MGLLQIQGYCMLSLQFLMLFPRSALLVNYSALTSMQVLDSTLKQAIGLCVWNLVVWEWSINPKLFKNGSRDLPMASSYLSVTFCDSPELARGVLQSIFRKYQVERSFERTFWVDQYRVRQQRLWMHFSIFRGIDATAFRIRVSGKFSLTDVSVR